MGKPFTSWPKCKKKADQGRGPLSPSRASILCLQDLPLAPPLNVFPFPNSATLGNKPLTHGPLGDIQDQNYITRSHLLKAPPPFIITTLGTKSLAHKRLRDILKP
jgi:hypothetical protein